MAKFFGNGGEFASSGDKEEVPLGFQSDGSVSYETGYGSAYGVNLLTDPDSRNVERKLFNQVLFEVTEALGILQQQGMWNWLSTVTYGRGMQVLYNNDAWLCVNPNLNSVPYDGNPNWLRMVTLFQQVGTAYTYGVNNGSVIPAPTKGATIAVVGWWKTERFRVDQPASLTVYVNGVGTYMEKQGKRNGGSGHGYYSNFIFPFSHIFYVNYNKGDAINVGISGYRVIDSNFMLTFLG